MPIRRALKLKKIWYHRKYGSVRNPPIIDQGVSGSVWPSGSLLTSADIARYRGKEIVIGWICYQAGVRTWGLWLCPILGVNRPFRPDGTLPPTTKRLPFIDGKYVQPGTYEYVSNEPETTHVYRLQTILMDAFADKHDLLL